MHYGYILALGLSVCVFTGCSSESGAQLSAKPSEETSVGMTVVNVHSGSDYLKARITVYTHTDFNQSQLEAVLRPIMAKESVLYLRKLATQGHVLVIKASDTASLQQKLDQIHNLDDVKLLEQDAILSIKEK